MSKMRSDKVPGGSSTPWEERHENDARGPLADNSSQIPDRSDRLNVGSAGETSPAHGSGYSQASDAKHPVFPDQGAEALLSGRTDEVRRRAHQLWEEEGKPEGLHEHHWLQAERELGGEMNKEQT
jgi:hypothetical protein